MEKGRYGNPLFSCELKGTPLNAILLKKWGILEGLLEDDGSLRFPMILSQVCLGCLVRAFWSLKNHCPRFFSCAPEVEPQKPLKICHRSRRTEIVCRVFLLNFRVKFYKVITGSSPRSYYLQTSNMWATATKPWHDIPSTPDIDQTDGFLKWWLVKIRM